MMDEIGRGAPGLRFLVQVRSLGDEKTHVSDVYSDLVDVLRDLLDRESVVQVFGC